MSNIESNIFKIIFLALAIMILYWFYLDHKENQQKVHNIKYIKGHEIEIGTLLIFLSAGVYFLLPLNAILGLQSSYLSTERSITLSSMYQICSTIGIFIGDQECQIINFISFSIFFIAFIGAILIIKGILDK